MQVLCQLNIQLAGNSLGLRRVVDGVSAQSLLKPAIVGFLCKGS